MKIPVGKLKQTECCQTEAIVAGEDAKQKEELVVALAHAPAKHVTVMVKAKTTTLAD